MNHTSKPLHKALSLALSLLLLLQIFPFGQFLTSSAALATDPLRPQLMGGSLDAGDDNVLSIYAFGDALIQGNSMMDIVKKFAEKDGIRLEIAANSWNNEKTSYSSTSTYNLWELFEWSAYASEGSVRPASGATLIAPKGTSLKFFLEAIESDVALANKKNPIDHVILLSGRDWSVNKHPDAQLQCVQWFANKISEHAPDAEINFFVPPGFSTSCSSSVKSAWGYSSSMTRTEHYALIEAHAQDQLDSLPDGVKGSLFPIGEAWEAYITNSDINCGSSLLMYSSDQRNPSLAGSYYNACLLYMMLTGNSPVGMDVYGQMQEEDAQHLQRAAHTYYFGEAPAFTTHNDANALTLDSLTEPCTTDSRLIESVSEYPTYFNELMAAAIAYDQRGSWVQYDQTSFNEKTSWDTLYRRVTSDDLFAPEQATPQNPYYTDCSAWTTTLYSYVFGFYFNSDGDTDKGSSNLTSTRNLCRLRDTYKNKGNNSKLCVWDWGDGSTVTTAQRDTVISDFYDNIQPGDMIVYTTSYGSTLEGHAVIYVGNGYIMHCSGASQAAMGGADYHYNAGHDKHEANGGILVEPLSVFTEPTGHRFIFTQAHEVVILRPFATGNLTPTAQATARLNNLLNIVAYKESSVSLGQTVTAGQEVTFTYHIKNLNSATKTVNITETLPSSLIYVSSDGTYDSSTGKVSFTSYVSPGEEKTLRLTVRVSQSASGTIAGNKTSTVNGVYLNTTPIKIGKTLSAAQQSKVAELLPTLSGYTDSYELAKALYAELGYALPFASGGAALTSVFNFHTASSSNTCTTDHFVLTGSSTAGIAMLAPHLFGGQYVACNHNVTCCTATYTVREGRVSGDYMRTRSMIEDYLIPGDLLIFGGVASSPTATVYIYAGNSTFYTSTSSGGLSVIKDSMTVQFLEGMLAKDAFCVLRPSLTLTCSKSDINVLYIGGTSNTASIRQSHSLLEKLLETDGGYTNAKVTALSTGGERLSFYDMFTSVTDSGVTLSTAIDFASYYNAMLSALAPDASVKYDYVMIAAGKEWNLVEQFSYDDREKAAFAHFEKLIYAHNPDATLVIEAGAGYKNINGADQPIRLWGSSTQKYFTVGDSAAGHTATIKGFAQDVKTQLDGNAISLKVEVLNAGDAWLLDEDNSLALYNTGYTNKQGTEQQQYYLPMSTSAYLVSGMMYNLITESTPASFTVTSWTDGSTSRSVTSAQLAEINTILKDATADLRILFVGGTASTTTLRNSDTALKAMLEASGEYKNVKVDNIAIGERGRLDMLFSSFDAEGNPTFHTSYTAYSDSLLAALFPTSAYKYDHVFVPVGRDWNLIEDLSYLDRETSGYLWLEKYLYAHNPEATLLVGAPAGYIDVDGSGEEIKFWGSSTQKYWVAGSSYADHTANIKKRATEVFDTLNANHIPLNVQLVNYGSAAVGTYNAGFTTHATGYSSAEGTEQKHYYGPADVGAFITAAALFSEITDISAAEIEVYDWAAGYCRSISNDCGKTVIKALDTSLSDINILLIAGNSVNATDKFSHSALELMLEQNGGYKDAKVDAIYLDGWVGRMDNIYSYTGSVAEGYTATGPNTSNTARAAIAQQIIDALAENALVKYDHVVINVAPFWNLTSSDGGVYGPREIAAFEYTEGLLAAHNPDAILHIVAGQGWLTAAEKNGTGVTADYKIYAGSSESSFMGNDFAGHTAAIMAQAELIKEKLDNNSTALDVSLLDAGSVMMSLNEYGIDTHGSQYTTLGGRTYHPYYSKVATYAFAATVYNTITGNSINDITVTEWNLDGEPIYITEAEQIDVNTALTKFFADISVLIIGGTTCAETTRESNDALYKMLVASGEYSNPFVERIDLNGYHGRLDQLFTWSGSTLISMKADTVATYGDINSRIKSALAADSEFKYDHVIIVGGANWTLTNSVENFSVREANSFNYMERLVYEHNPEATLYITTPKGWMSAAEYGSADGDHTIQITSGSNTYYVADDFTDHNAKLLAQAQKTADVLASNAYPLNVEILDFASAATQAYNAGKLLHNTSASTSFGDSYHFYPNDFSANLFAALAYSKITGLPYYSVFTTEWGSDRSITSDELPIIQSILKGESSVGETITGYTLTLQGATVGEHGGDIGINLKMLLSDKLISDENAYVKVDFNGKTTLVPLSELSYDAESGKYSLKTYVAAKYMTEKITATVYNGNGEHGSAYSYSVQGYGEQIVKYYASSFPTLVPMVQAMLNYGAAAQSYFGVNTDKLANAALSYEDSWQLIDEMVSIDNVTAAIYNGAMEDVGITKHSASLFLNAETVIRHYITLADGASVGDYTFKVGNAAVTPVATGNRYYIDIDHIAASALDTGYVLTVTRSSDGAEYSVTYSALNYAQSMFEACKDNASYSSLCDLLKAIYLYNSAANTYFGK